MLSVKKQIHRIPDFSGTGVSFIPAVSGASAVFLNTNDKPYVEPDISVICNNSKLDDRGCNGAPNWIVNPLTRTVNVYDLEKEELTDLYSFDDDIQVCIYDDLMINITELLR